MNSNLNLLFAWLWILSGFVSGMVLGLFFHGENWLGGYGSFKRRMYRLAHISFFGLGAVNLLFALTVKNASAAGPFMEIASWAFIIGAITMPLCCVIMAHFPNANMIFSVPVLSLIIGAVLTLVLIYTGQTHFAHDLQTSTIAPDGHSWARMFVVANPLNLCSSVSIRGQSFL